MYQLLLKTLGERPQSPQKSLIVYGPSISLQIFSALEKIQWEETEERTLKGQIEGTLRIKDGERNALSANIVKMLFTGK